MSEDEIRVRGRDFTGYRIAGAVAALLLLVALAVQTYELFDGDHLTRPESSWSARIAGTDGNDMPEGSRTIAAEVLAARTRLQDERWRTGPSPEAMPSPLAVGAGEFLIERPLDDPDDLPTRNWSVADGDTLAMLRESAPVAGLSSLPYNGAALFERPAARDWRWGMADIVTHLGAIVILGFSLLLALLLAIRGRVPIARGKSLEKVKRFNWFERANHWLTATSFIGLALTGIVIGYGDTLIRPFGEPLLGTLGWWSTWGHAMFAPGFALGVTAMLVLWVRRNLPSRLDLNWLARAGGFFSDDPDNPPARKFNAGQKLIFWSAVLGGWLMVASGVTLMFPGFWLGLDAMGWVMLTHAVFATFLIAIFIGHIYIGTVGMQGAFDAMWSGWVDRNWAEEHHDLWLAEIERKHPERST